MAKQNYMYSKAHDGKIPVETVKRWSHEVKRKPHVKTAADPVSEPESVSALQRLIPGLVLGAAGAGYGALQSPGKSRLRGAVVGGTAGAGAGLGLEAARTFIQSPHGDPMSDGGNTASLFGGAALGGLGGLKAGRELAEYLQLGNQRDDTEDDLSELDARRARSWLPSGLSDLLATERHKKAGSLDKAAGRFDGALKAVTNWAIPAAVGGGAAAGDYYVSGSVPEAAMIGLGAAGLVHPSSRQAMINSSRVRHAGPLGAGMTQRAIDGHGLLKGHTMALGAKGALVAGLRVPDLLNSANESARHVNDALANVSKATGEMTAADADGSSAFSKLRGGLRAVGDAGVSAGSDIAASAKAFSSASGSLSGLTNSLNDISSFVKGTPENPGLLTRAINSQEQLGKTFSDSLEFVKSRAPYIAGGALGLGALKVYMDSVRQQKEDERDAKRFGYHKAALFEGDALSTGRPPKPPTQQPWSLTTSKGKSTIRNSNIPSKPISVKLSSHAEDYAKLLLDLSNRRSE